MNIHNKVSYDRLSIFFAYIPWEIFSEIVYKNLHKV